MLFISSSAYSAVENTGNITAVKIWGGIAKATVCNSGNSCREYWVSLADTKGNSVLSMWLTAKVAESRVYIQGYNPDKPEHPYNNASKFYGMNLQ